MEKETMGDRIKKLAAEHNETPRQLARIIGVGRQSVYKWFNDEGIKESNLRALAAHYRVSVTYLREGQEPKPQIDAELLAEIAKVVEDEAEKLSLRLNSDLRGRLYSIFYRHFIAVHRVDRELIHDHLQLIAKAG